MEAAKTTVESAEVIWEEVERILGCSRVHTNRILYDLRGGRISHVPFRDQILSLLADREKKTAELVAAIDGNPQTIGNELNRLVDAGEIVRGRRAVYALPER